MNVEKDFNEQDMRENYTWSVTGRILGMSDYELDQAIRDGRLKPTGIRMVGRNKMKIGFRAEDVRRMGVIRGLHLTDEDLKNGFYVRTHEAEKELLRAGYSPEEIKRMLTQELNEGIMIRGAACYLRQQIDGLVDTRRKELDREKKRIREMLADMGGPYH